MSDSATPVTQPTDGNSSMNTKDTSGNFFTRGWESMKDAPHAYREYVKSLLPEDYQKKNWLVNLLSALPPFFFFIFVGLLILAGILGRLKPFLKHISEAIVSVFSSSKGKD
jgi:hypothetical protein